MAQVVLYDQGSIRGRGLQMKISIRRRPLLLALLILAISMSAGAVSLSRPLSGTAPNTGTLGSVPVVIPNDAKPRPLTAGTCDTAGPIEVESSGGSLAGVPTA